MKTQEQIYAKAVHDQIYAIWAEEEKYRTRYGAMAHKLPILMRTAGLAQALAFADTRKPPQRKLLEHLAATVLGANTNADQLLERSREAPMLEYMRLTHDVMLALAWYKRFAQSILGVDPSDDPDEGGDDHG